VERATAAGGDRDLSRRRHIETLGSVGGAATTPSRRSKIGRFTAHDADPAPVTIHFYQDAPSVA
jgi:hypothetical protein